MNATATNLGYQEDTGYIITEECQDVLEQLLHNIKQESKVKCQARRNVTNSRLIHMDLIPILCHSHEDPGVFDAIVRLLMHLSMPLEVIMPIVKKLTRKDYQDRHELQKMLEDIKKEFTQVRVTSALISQMALIIDEAGSHPIDSTNAETLSNCLTLLRNVLYVNYERYKVGSLKNDTIIGNLFTSGFQDVLKDMCRRNEGVKWLSSLLQVLHLMYKDTSSSKMVAYLRQKHERKELEDQAVEGSTPELAASNNNSQPAESEGEATTIARKEIEQPVLPKEEEIVTTDSPEPSLPEMLGYEGGVSPSTSGYEEGVSQPEASSSQLFSEALLSDQTSQDSCWSETSSQTLSRSNTLVDDSDEGTIQQRETTTSSDSSGSGSSGSGSSGSSTSLETDFGKESVKDLKRGNMKKLAEFGLDYIKHGMDNILIQCKEDLKNMVTNHYYLWQMNFFLPFTTLQSVAYTDVKLTLSAPVFSQLVSSMMNTWEGFVQASKQRNNDSKSNSVFKILNMQASTLRQMLHSIQQFTTNPQSTDVIHMKTMLATVVLTKSVRNFYHLLIRKFQPHQQTLAFLREIIIGNDLVLRIIDQVQHIERPEWGKLDMSDHIRKFASRPIMRVYNYMLSKFSHNTLEENEVVMTMMHHIAVDIAQPEMLYQIPILTTFASLWEAGSSHITKESHNLIDYVVHEFCVLGSTNKEKCLQTVAMLDIIRPPKRKRITDASSDGQSKAKKFCDVRGEVKGLYVPRDESDDEFEEEKKTKISLKPIEMLSIDDCIKSLKMKGFGNEILELQDVLLELCYFKLNGPKVHIGEPHIWHCCSNGKSVPIIPYTEKAEAAQGNPHFKALLHNLGLHNPQDTGRLNPSVPSFWTSDMCYKAAVRLGDIDESNLKFEMDHVQKLPLEFKEIPGMTQDDPMLDLEDLEPDKKPMEPSNVGPLYFQVPSRMWCNVIKRANTCKVV